MLTGADELLDDEDDEVIVLDTDVVVSEVMGAEELLDDVDEDSLVLVSDELKSEVRLLLVTEDESVLELNVVVPVLLLVVTDDVDEVVAEETLSDKVDVLDVWL